MRPAGRERQAGSAASQSRQTLRSGSRPSRPQPGPRARERLHAAGLSQPCGGPRSPEPGAAGACPALAPEILPPCLPRQGGAATRAARRPCPPRRRRAAPDRPSDRRTASPRPLLAVRVPWQRFSRLWPHRQGQRACAAASQHEAGPRGVAGRRQRGGAPHRQSSARCAASAPRRRVWLLRCLLPRLACSLRQAAGATPVQSPWEVHAAAPVFAPDPIRMTGLQGGQERVPPRRPLPRLPPSPRLRPPLWGAGAQSQGALEEGSVSQQALRQAIRVRMAPRLALWEGLARHRSPSRNSVPEA